MQKTLVGVLTATTVALGVLCAVQWKQLRASKERIRAVEEASRAESETREAQSARVKDLERNRALLDQRVQEFAAVTSVLRANEAGQTSNLTAVAERVRAAGLKGGEQSAASGGGEGGLFGKGMGDMVAKMMKDPAMREMMRGQQKAAINMMYSGLFKELNLTPAEKEKLTGILTDAQMKNVEHAQGMFGEQKPGAAEEAQQLFEDSKKQTDAEVKAVLGDDRFAQYDDYQKNIGDRMQLDQLKTQLEAKNLPLQDQQMAQLLQVMNEEKTAVPPAIPADASQSPKDLKALMTPENLDRQMQWTDDYNRRVLERAAQILTPEQLKQYQEFQDQQSAIQKFGLKMARDLFGDGKGSPATERAPGN
jgi:hypothetical protein